MIGREFAHIHPRPDYGSLAPHDAVEVAGNGWGEHHPLVCDGIQPPGLVMVYSPRDEAELEVVKTIISRSHEYACGACSQRACLSEQEMNVKRILMGVIASAMISTASHAVEIETRVC